MLALRVNQLRNRAGASRVLPLKAALDTATADNAKVRADCERIRSANARLHAENRQLRTENAQLRASLVHYTAQAAADTPPYAPREMTAGTSIGPRRRAPEAHRARKATKA